MCFRPATLLAGVLGVASATTGGPVQARGGSAEPSTPRVARRGERTREAPALGVRSSGGTDRGQFELILGAVTLGVAAALGIAGGFAIASGIDKKRSCPVGFEQARCQLVPPALDYTAAGLSFGLMVPLTVAGALLLRKGTRIRRDHDAFHARRGALGVGGARRLVGISWTVSF